MSNWEQVSFSKYSDLKSDPIIGDGDADNEWSDATELIATNLFVPTDSYRIFCQTDTLFIFGRRGTGKSALFHMLNHEVAISNNKTYQYCRRINQEKAYREFARQIRSTPLETLPMADLIYEVKEKWLWIIKVSAMLSIFEDKSVSNNEKPKIQRYLKRAGIIEKSPFSVLADYISKELKAVNDAHTRLAAALLKLGDRLSSADYVYAEKELYSILKSKKQTNLILIDSIERYNINDKVSDAVLSGLVQAILEIYRDRENRILAKAAFPSEMLPHVPIQNWGKIDNRMHMIRWNHKDLVRLLAKRYYKNVINKTAKPTEIAVYDNYHKAISLLYEHFPSTINTRSGIPFDTMAYIISHTQRKPRELIRLMNSILTLAMRENGEIKNIKKEIVVDGVHALIDGLYREALNIYTEIYPHADKIVSRVLFESNAYFSSSELDKKLKGIESLLNVDTNGAKIKREDVKSLLLESGVLGIDVESVGWHDNKRVLSALFEYQIKGQLSLQNHKMCVIHPMFYQTLRVQADMDTYVYPKPNDDVTGEIEFDKLLKVD